MRGERRTRTRNDARPGGDGGRPGGGKSQQKSVARSEGKSHSGELGQKERTNSAHREARVQ